MSWDRIGIPARTWAPYILKGGICGNRIPQTIWNFRRKIVWERKKYQDYTVCRANWRSFPLLMFSHCNKLSIKTLKHTIFSMKIPHWHQILVIFMIYALLSRNFDVRIYALFPQIFGNWKVGSADFFTFRMYAQINESHLRIFHFAVCPVLLLLGCLSILFSISLRSVLKPEILVVAGQMIGDSFDI